MKRLLKLLGVLAGMVAVAVLAVLALICVVANALGEQSANQPPADRPIRSVP